MTDYYFSSAGDDTDAGTEAEPWQTWGKFLDTFESANGGDNIYFKRGETHDVDEERQIYNTNVSDTSRLTIGAYGTGDDPIISPTGNFKPMYFGSLKTGETRDGGVNIQNLNFKCSTRNLADRAIWLQNAFSYVTMDSITVDGFSTGLHTGKFGNTNGAEDIVLINSTIKNNNTQGFYGGSHRLILDNNTFDNNGNGADSLGHNVYLAETASTGANVGFSCQVTNNKFLRNSQRYEDVVDVGTDDWTTDPIIGETVTGSISGATGVIRELDTDQMTITLPDRDLSTRFIATDVITSDGSKVANNAVTASNPWDQSVSANLVVHGKFDGLVIRDNWLEQGWNDVTGAFASAQGFGIGVGPGYNGGLGSEYFNNTVIQGNTCIHQATPISVSGGIGIEISNNFVRTSTRFTKGIFVDNTGDPDSVVTNDVNIVYNTVLMEQDPQATTASKRGIELLDVVDGFIDHNRVFVHDDSGIIGIRTESQVTVGDNNLTMEYTEQHMAVGTDSLDN